MNFKREPLQVAGLNAELITIQTNEQNSLTKGHLLELGEIFKQIQADEQIKAVVLCSDNEKFFCNGMDAKNILTLYQQSTEKGTGPNSHLSIGEEMLSIVLFFGELVQFTKPLISEVCGYAMGGGAVLTVASDYKFMMTGKARISFTEVLMGLPLPGSFIDKIKQTVLGPYWNEVCMEGASFLAQEAKDRGLISEIAPDRAGIRALTLKKLEALAKVPSSAFQLTKESLNKGLVERLKGNNQETIKNFNNPLIMSNLLEGMLALKEKRSPNFK